MDNADAYGRGGLLPMAVFLTQNAPGLRTSPVKRGYWVARRVLGEVIPPPPPVVPELPHDESKSDLPVRDLLAKHRANAVCASCHARFDSFGLTFEGYGPVGERRTKDLAGRAVDTHAHVPGWRSGRGLQGLQAYIRAHREKDFINNLSEKMLVYALGRSPLLSDEPLLDTMRTNLAAGGYRFSSLIETIVTSPQFLNMRNRADHFRRERRLKMPDRTKPSANRIARRAILRGAGVTMALPWLESFAAKAATTGADACSRNGSAWSSWAAASTRITGRSEGSGAEMKLGKTLSPLEPLKSKVNVIHGLFNKGAMGLGIHPPQTGSLLTGAKLETRRQHSFGHLGRPDDRQPRRPGHAAIEPGARLRTAHHRIPRVQLLAGLQLSHLLAESRIAGSQRVLSRL